MKQKIKTGTSLNVLFLEDDPKDAEICRELILDSGYNLNMDITATEKEFESFLLTRKYDVILSDFNLAGFDAFGALRIYNKICPNVPFICVSGTIGEEIAVELLKSGAVDYLLKDRLERLPFAIKKAVDDGKEKESRQKTEILLTASEMQYRRLFESAKDGILILNVETGKIVDVNPFLIKLLDYSKEEFLEKEIWEIGFFKNIVANKEKFVELQQKKYVRYEDLPLEASDGRKIHVEFVSNVYSVNAHKVIQCNIRDITERKRGEKKEKELEAKYTKLYGSIRDAILVADTDRKIIDCNPAFTEMFGYALNDIKNKNTATIYENIKQFNELGQALKNHSTEKSPLSYTINYKRKNGEVFPGETSVSYLRNLNGDFTGFIGLIRDVTERKLSENTIINAHKMLRTLIDNLPAMIYVKDIECRKVIANIADVNNIGNQNEEEILGKTDVELFPGEIGQRGYADDQQVINSGSAIINKIEEFFNSEGNRRWISTTKIPLRNNEGEITGLVGIGQDITEQKKLETNLSTAVEIAKLGYWEFDVKSGNFIFDEQYYRLIHGSSTEKQGGNSMSAEEFARRLVHPDDSKMIGAKLQEAISSPDPEYLGQDEARVFRDEGSITNVMVQFKVIKDDTGRTIKVVGVNQDITEQKRFEQELIESKNKAEESDRLKSAFLSNMSHEIRTPMNGILGFTELLKEPKLSGEEQQAFIDIIEKSGARMLNIINDIINISRIESGQIKLSVSDVNVTELARDIFDFFKPEAEKKELNFSYKNMLPASEEFAKTDKEKVYAVLTNLVKNALKFTKTGSVEMGYEKKDNFFEFFVKDTGSGIPQEQKEFIFERFRQGSESTTRNYEGAGLGLAISNAYVDMLGGKIWLESSVGQGSIFRFTIPYLNGKEEKEKLSVITEEVVHQSGNLKILIVDDDETSRELLEIMIKPLSSNFLQAITGLEAIEICRNNSDLDLVLMDIQMPGMDGYEATRQIRKSNKDVVIIAQTAYALSGDREKALEAGCNDYISKPIKMKVLKEMIRGCVFQS